MSSEKKQVVVLGAGYAGLMAALRLAGKTSKLNTDVILINGADTFVQRPRLHHVATGQVVPEEPLVEMLQGSRAQFLQGWVTAVDPETHVVNVETTSGPQQVAYDILVYALGSVVDQESVPGVREHAYVLNPGGANGATAMWEKLEALAGSKGRVVVAGGGTTGVEGAAEIKAYYPELEVSLVTSGRFADFKGPRVEKHIRDGFRKLGIAVREHSQIVAVEAGQLKLENGQTISFDLCLWAGGFRALPLARAAGFAVNERGQILVDPFGRSLDHHNVYAIGDAAHPVEEPGVPLRMSLITAITRGAHAADNIVALLTGKDQTPLSFAYYGQGIAMGPGDAVGFFGFPTGDPLGPILRGKTAVLVRNFFVWLLFYFLKLERRRPGFYLWLGKGRYAKGKRSVVSPQPSVISQ
jgi:NADH dehydrogenase FAD-containing subunit